MRLLTIASIVTASFAAPAFADDREFTLINNSSHDVTEMYLSPHEKDSWGDNILTVDAVRAGTRRTIPITDGEQVGDHDIRFVTAERPTLEGIQGISKLGTHTLHD